VFFLILESLGSTELVFILLMALVFFGPRKLPQLSRSLGKNLASFRRASEDFKRTWDREVTLEEFSLSTKTTTNSAASEPNSILAETNSQTTNPETLEAPSIHAVAPELVIPREATNPAAADDEQNLPAAAPEPTSKRDWL
jgi:Tat protein translocase TatB subunit